ncbi:MAG: SGNH/GDSL hydrolase family protein [Phenylobacterium sp.]
MRRLTVVAAWLAALALCAANKPAIPEGSTYVALGSSFAAGPGIANIATDSPGRCGQSAENYARQVARALKLKLVDRSCGGATTADVLGTGPLGLPPQVDGLTADTALVTVTIGGNDIRYMADLGTAVCRKSPGSFPEAARARACATPADFDLEAAFAATERGLAAIAAGVRRRSPKARLVFVDYVTVLPAGSPCAATPIQAADANELRLRADRLARLTERVAKASGADLVKASDLTRGHDACAAPPWVEGFVPRREGVAWGPVSFHPRLEAMTAIAIALEKKLGK